MHPKPCNTAATLPIVFSELLYAHDVPCAHAEHRNNLLFMPIQLKPEEIQAFKRHLEDLGLLSVATYRVWCQDHGFDPAVKKHWWDRRQEQLTARRMGTKDEDEDALKAHIAALGLDSTSEYQIWCRTNRFSGKLYKTPSQRVQERRMLGQLRRQAQQAGSLRHTRKTGTIEQIYAGDLDGEHPAHPYLYIIHNHFQTLRAADQPDIADACLALLRVAEQRAIPQPVFSGMSAPVHCCVTLCRPSCRCRVPGTFSINTTGTGPCREI